MKNVKKLTLFSAISVVIGCVVGSGVFVKPGRVLEAAGSSNMALLAWILGGLISLTGALTLSEISSRMPKTGGIYVYIEELFGKPWAFVSGWMQSIIYGPALSSALSLYFASLTAQFLEIPDTAVKPIAVVALLAVASTTAFSTSCGALIQNTTTFIKLIPIAVLGVAGLLWGNAEVFDVAIPTATPNATGMGVAVLATLWAYDGWVQVSNMGDEIKNPSKNIPRAFLFGIVGVMLAYIIVNISLFHVVPAGQVATLNERAAAVAAETLFGTFGGKALGLGILISIFGCLNGNVLTMSRIPFAMASRGSFPFANTFSKVHPTRQTPVNSVILKTFIAMLMILMLNPDRITDIAMFTIYLCYSAVFLGVFILRKKVGPPKKGSYSVPLYPVMPVLASAGSLYVCWSMVTQQPWDAVISLVVTFSGLPLYFWLNRKPVAEPAVPAPVVVVLDE